VFDAFSSGSLINDLEEGVNITFMILGNVSVLQMPIRRDKKRKEIKKSNSMKSLLFYVCVSQAKQEHLPFSHVLRSSSILFFLESVQFPRATFMLNCFSVIEVLAFFSLTFC